MAKRPCARPGCAALVERGFCAACKPKSPAAVAEKQRGSAAARGYGRRWQKASAARLRSHPLCVGWPRGVHAAGCRRAAELTDHIVPHKGDMGLFWDAENWQSLSWACHSAKTVAEDGGFGR